MTVQRTGNLNATPQYENEHGCRSYVGELPTGHVCMKPETVIHDGRMFCDEHRPEEVFVNLPERIQKYWGDGADEKNRATLELDEATANVAKAAELVIEFIDLLDPYKEQWLALRDAIANRRAKQEAFLRAMANQPDPNNTGRDGQLPALTGSKIWTRTQAPAAALGPCICKDLEDTGNQ